MNNKLVPIVIVSLVSLIIGYTFFLISINKGGPQVIAGLITFSFSLITLLTSFGLDLSSSRLKTLIGVTGITFFMIGLIVFLIIILFTNSIPWLIIPFGLITSLHLGVVHFLTKSEQ